MFLPFTMEIYLVKIRNKNTGLLKLGSHRTINPDSIAKLAINQVITKMEIAAKFQGD